MPMLPRAHLALAFLASVCLAACGGQTGSSGSADGGSEGGGATPAEGGGVCCPIASDPCGACDTGAGGGWAPNAAACTPNANAACDGKLGVVTDAHGCPVIAAGDSVPGAACCGCPTSGGSTNPTCTLSGSTWQCPAPYGGAIPACPADASPDVSCDADAGSCFECQQGAGVHCTCAPGGADGGSSWTCIGTGVACE